MLEHHLDPSKIRGTGKDGRLTKDDVLTAAKVHEAEAQSRAGPGAAARGSAARVRAAPRDQRRAWRGTGADDARMRQTIARRLKDAQNTAAMLTTFNDVDMSAVIAARNRYKDLFEKKLGIRLGFMGFFVKAAALALRDVPAVNATIDGDEIVYRDYFDISVAVSAPQGPGRPGDPRRRQDCASPRSSRSIADFGKRAKDGTLTIEDMQGGTFTITNGGVFGSLMSTPIINPPQSARARHAPDRGAARWSATARSSPGR